MEIKRVHVMGVSGSGKTTVARRISENMHIQHVEIDAINWQANWQPLPTEVLCAKIAEVVKGDAWVIDGNYREARELVWERVQLVVFLDFPVATMLYRLIRRTFQRIIGKQVLWSGNRENLRTALFSRDSLILYSLRTRKFRQWEFESGCRDPRYRHIAFRRFTNQAAVEAFIAELSSDGSLSR
jgi:adenylate kinase family enzyme